MQNRKASNLSEKGISRATESLRLESLFDLPVDLCKLFNDLPIGILLMDLGRRVVFINQALEGIVGLTQKEACGLPCFHVVRSRTCIQHCASIDAKPITESIRFESDLINRERKLIPIRTTIATVFDRRGAPVGFLETIEDVRSLKELDERLGHAYSFGNIIGKSYQMEKLFRILPVIAQSDSSVLITGETGTGKDLLAEAIHQASGRAKGPFIKVNCGALPETLLESELFGHKKGAFTGAVGDKLGRFHLAHNGSLYLTEIGDLPLLLQVKLLTFLDDKTVFPLGSTKGFAADVRIIAATHHDLEQMVKQGHFREDLFFRLNVLRLQLAPLREREGDIRLLLDHFLNNFNEKFHSDTNGVSTRALKILLDYDYPGNVRELKNIIEYAVNMCREGKIYPKHLPSYLTEPQSGLIPFHVDSPAAADSEGPVHGASHAGESNQNWPELERKMITDALLKARGHRTRAAAALGWARSTLWRKMKLYGIDEACRKNSS